MVTMVTKDVKKNSLERQQSSAQANSPSGLWKTKGQSSRAEQGGESDIKARQDFTRGYMSSSLAWVCGFRPENTRVCLSILFSISLSEDSPRNSEKAVDQRARGLNPAPATCLSCARHIIGKLRLRKGQWRAQGHKAPKYMRSSKLSTSGDGVCGLSTSRSSRPRFRRGTGRAGVQHLTWSFRWTPASSLEQSGVERAPQPLLSRPAPLPFSPKPPGLQDVGCVQPPASVQPACPGTALGAGGGRGAGFKTTASSC
uniref:Uncharacterized protein LOC110195500 n=1 Tax=Phascolarctos cinereus TaxID=38626 RepID=A0A6P5IZG3_PHACI|nr:uncharacterized protein LOC110195500 [Phascolarctos cinereus]